MKTKRQLQLHLQHKSAYPVPRERPRTHTIISDCCCQECTHTHTKLDTYAVINISHNCLLQTGRFQISVSQPVVQLSSVILEVVSDCTYGTPAHLPPGSETKNTTVVKQSMLFCTQKALHPEPLTGVCCLASCLPTQK